MKEKLAVFLLYAFLFTSNCINVDSENVTTITELELKSENKTEVKMTEKNFEDLTTLPNFVHKIPPTLQNIKNTRSSVIHKENQQSASIVNKSPQIILDGKLEQAILQSKTQNLKIAEKSNYQTRLEARPEFQTEQSEISTPTSIVKEFIPSPELKNFFLTDSGIRDYFHPMNPLQDNFFKNAITEPRVLGVNNPNDILNINPPEVHPHYLAQHGIKNTNIDYDRLSNYHFHQRSNQEQSSMVFPTESSLLSLEEVIRTVQELPTKLPEIKSYDPRLQKGSWKWVSDTEDKFKFFNPENKLTQFDFVRHHTVHDRPYSFESSDIFTQPTTPHSGSEEGEINTGRPISEDEENLKYKNFKYVK